MVALNDLHLVLLFAGAIATVPFATANPQHEGHQTSAVAPTSSPNPRCAEAGRKALALVGAIDTRPAGEGAAGDAQSELAELQRAVSAAAAELFACKAAVSVDSMTTPTGATHGMDHSKMNVGTSAPAAKPAERMAGMDHSKMHMEKPAGRGTKPGEPMAGMDHSKMAMGKPAGRGAKPADPMAGMDHSKMNAEPLTGAAKPRPSATTPETGAPAPAATPAGGAGKLPVMMAQRIPDPACPDTVGQATAPKSVFERKVYYFCSVEARDEFRKDPAAYLKKHPR